MYHGTDIDSAKAICALQKADVNKGSKKVDFGPGFYLTHDYEKAVQWAHRKSIVRMKSAAVLTVDFDIEAARDLIEEFEEDIRWGRFIINNRNGIKYIDRVPFKDNNLDARYSITHGRVADIDVVNYANELNESGKMLDSVERILNREYAMQYAFHTEEAISYIRKYVYQNV